MKVLLVLLVIGVIATSLGVIYSRHESRVLFVKLTDLQSHADALNIEWGQLQLEQSTWATHGRIEKLATEKLNMHIPTHNEVVIVRP